MYILNVRENANSPWQTIDALVGPTPIKGKDYFTEEEINQIKEDVANMVDDDFATKDYVDQAIAAITDGEEVSY